jgi:hypothetical protein
MSRYGRSREEIDLDIAYAVGEGMDVVEYLRQQHRARGWNGR